MMKYIKCKHKNIFEEIKKRDNSIHAVLDREIESLISIEEGNQDVFNLCHEVLFALGYIEKVKLNKAFLDNEQPIPFVKVY